MSELKLNFPGCGFPLEQRKEKKNKDADSCALDTVVPYPSSCSDLHYECEMVVAIGEGGKDIPVGEALK